MSRLTITITWSVVQPNIRRPLYVHLFSLVLDSFPECAMKKETRLRLLDNTTSIA